MLRRPHRQPRARAHADDDMLAAGLQPAQLSGIFRAPAWLRDLGVASWLLVGVTGLLIGSVWILSLIDTIVIPVVTATIIAAVLSPVVRALARHMPRAAAAAIVFLSLIVLGAVVGLMVMSGIVDQAEQLQGSLQSAVDKAQEHLKDAGVSDSKAQSTGDDASANISSAFHALISGLGTGIEALAGVAIFLSFTALSLFFLLKDGPVIRAWAEAHMGVPAPVGKIVAGRTLQSLRGYFAGVTAVAAFNGIVIGLGALVLGVSEPGAIAMIVIVLLANGVLQQMIQPIAYGAALGIHPLAVLVVTIAGGALFGTIGLVLGAPLTSAVIKISSDVAKARAAEAEEEEAAPGAAAPEPAP
jgi:putative heme transporter